MEVAASDFMACMFTDTSMAPELITTRQAADRLGLTTSALHELHCRDDGLTIVQKGFLVGYQTTDAESRSMILLEMLSKPVRMRIGTASLRKAG
jgi:hypothetical protein